MKTPRFKSDSILDNPPPVSDSAAANALVHVPGNELGAAHDLGNTSDGVIEGEFIVEELSGFSCRVCGRRLFVGASSCPKCGKQFPIPTPDVKNVPHGYSPERARVMAVIYRDRKTDAEIELNFAKRGLKRPADGWE